MADAVGAATVAPDATVAFGGVVDVGTVAGVVDAGVVACVVAAAAVGVVAAKCAAGADGSAPVIGKVCSGGGCTKLDGASRRASSVNTRDANSPNPLGASGAFAAVDLLAMLACGTASDLRDFTETFRGATTGAAAGCKMLNEYTTWHHSSKELGPCGEADAVFCLEK